MVGANANNDKIKIKFLEGWKSSKITIQDIRKGKKPNKPIKIFKYGRLKNILHTAYIIATKIIFAIFFSYHLYIFFI